MKYLLGIDNGGTATKAAIFDIKGKEIAVSQQPTPIICPNENWFERDMNLLWNTTANVIKSAILQSDISPDDIAGVSCTGHGKGLYLWGQNDKPAYNAIASTDRRALDIVDGWDKNGTSEIARKTSYQRVLPCQPVALLAWFKNHKPDVYNNIKWIFEAKDYIRFMLTGEAYAEVTDYSGTNLMNLKKRTFDSDLLKLFGIEDMLGCLPPLILSHQLSGVVSKTASVVTGIPVGTPVSGGMFDIDACAIAMNVLNEESLCAITGTWSINEYLSRSPVYDEPSTLNSLFCIPEFYLIEESSPTSAGNLEWIVETFFHDSSKTKKQIYQDIDEMVFNTTPDESSITFLPFLYGSNIDGIQNAAFIGLSQYHSMPHILRSVFEGVVFSHAYHIEKLLAHRSKPKSIRLSGGACNSAVWVQMFADILQIPIEIVTTKELGTLGACISASIAAEIYPDYKSATLAMCGSFKTIYPNENLAHIYNMKYNAYKSSCQLF